ncbi:MAG: hypothetical protein V1929_09130 [bacterium]
MFQRGASGETTVDMASKALAVKHAVSPIVDISGGTPATIPLLYATDGMVGILAVNLLYLASGAGSAGAVNIGTAADADAVIDAFDTSITAVAGDVDECTLADTLRATYPKSGGYPVLAEGDALIATITAGDSNTGDFVIQVDYFDIEKGT